MTRSITFDLDTGDLVSVDAPAGQNASTTGEVGARIACHFLPGMTPEALDAAYTAWISGDQINPNADTVTSVGALVLAPQGYHGKVIAVRSADGIVHSVQVRLDLADGAQVSEWYSPAELIMAAEAI